MPAALGAALGVALAESKGKTISALMAYSDRLERFTHWYVQLWAESLGKEGKGTTPLGALGPVDQHSQVQLFIAGPRDKLFTSSPSAPPGSGPRMDGELARLAGEPGFAGKTIGDLVAAEGRATAETLANNGCPVRSFHVDTLDEESLGELLMHFMLETIVAAHLLGIDAFDQPAVEEGKVLAKKYLTRASHSGRRDARGRNPGARPSSTLSLDSGLAAGLRPNGAKSPIGWPRPGMTVNHAPHHRHHLYRRIRTGGKLRAGLRAGRAERQQGVERGAAALRRARFALAAQRRRHPADAARRQPADQGGRHRHRGAELPRPDPQPGRGARAAHRADPGGGGEADPRRATKVPKAAKKRRLEGKRHRADIKKMRSGKALD